jgi:hypothetical protein
MSVEQILRYAYPARATGLSKDEVRKNLVVAGWEENDIDQALEKVFPKHATPIRHDGDTAPTPPDTNSKKRFLRLALVFIGLIAILGVIAVALSTSS